MNSNITKRSSSAATRLYSSSSTNTSTSTRTKRVKRIRRKPRKKSLDVPVILLTILTCIMVILTFFYLSNFMEQQTPAAKLERIGSAKNSMRLDLDNVIPKKSIKDRISRMKRDLGKYHHSDWMKTVGDKSVHYTQLRKKYDEILPEDDIQRMKDKVDSLRKRKYHNLMKDDMPYHIHDCPEYPPPNYPYAWNVKDVLDNWPPDDTTPRTHIYQGVCVFDFNTEQHKAINYREAEVPFVVRDDPSVLRTVERWAQPDYLHELLGEKTKYRTEFSHDNHFMYWNQPKKKARKEGLVPEDWSPPTEMTRMPYKEWLKHANITNIENVEADEDHWYFRLIGCGEMGSCDKDSSEYLFDELAFFQPREENELYMVNPKQQKGIHCRFGMKGVIAENHFDGSRNMIVVLGGERRYLLSHPDQCENLALLPKGHPSARHSAVDWSDPNYEEFPQFSDAEINEVVMQPGDVLYLPTHWFHYIVSLELNFQCNTRSGVSNEYLNYIHECGF